MFRRTGRVVRLARIAGSIVGLATYALQYPLTTPTNVVFGAILAGYVVLSVVMFELARHDWWLDIGAAPFEAMLDLIVVGVAIYVTGGYASAYFIFGTLFIISALIRWGWRESFVVAVAFFAVFLIASLAAYVGRGDAIVIDPARVTARVGSLAILVLLIGWVGTRRLVPVEMAEITAGDGDRGDRYDQMLAAIGAALGADLVTLARTEGDGLMTVRSTDGGLRSDRIVALDADMPEFAAPFLFGLSPERYCARGIAMFGLRSRSRLLPHRWFCEQLGQGTGLVIPFATATVRGVIVASRLREANIDDIDRAEGIARRIAEMSAEDARGRELREAAVLATKLDAAQDIHDTVVQALAGTAFRLQALKSWIAAGRDAAAEIDRLIADVRREQTKARDFIGRLRSPVADEPPCDIVATVRDAAAIESRTWGITCPVATAGQPIVAAAWLGHELRMLVREGVSNAVRHGHARTVTFTLAAIDDWLDLTIEDDGTGFSSHVDAAGPVLPWSLNRRVQMLGGTLALQTHAGTRIVMNIPLGGNR